MILDPTEDQHCAQKNEVRVKGAVTESIITIG
jgi:hypothetical protein